MNASGSATVWVHVVRYGSGQVVSGSVGFGVRCDFPGEVTITGMHIHREAAGTNGPVTINSGLRRQPSGAGTGWSPRFP